MLTGSMGGVQMEWSVDEVTRFIETACRNKFGNDKTEQYKRLVIENDVDGEVSAVVLCCSSGSPLLNNSLNGRRHVHML